MSYKLIHGDCLEVLPTLEAGSVDAVVTDPPYGMNKAEWDEYKLFSIEWLDLALKFDCLIASFCGVRGIADYSGFDWVMSWTRSGSTQRSGKLKGFNNWEPILLYNVKSLSNDVIKLPNYHVDTGHPTTKPVRLMTEIITRLTKVGDTIIDPFMGSGTTGVAAMKTGRNFIGIELDAEYFTIAEQRIKNAAGDYVATDKEKDSPQPSLFW